MDNRIKEAIARESKKINDPLWIKITEILNKEIYYSAQADGYVIHGAIEKLYQLFQSSFPCAGVWVKASERLPDEYSYVKAKICGIELKEKIRYSEGAFFSNDGKLVYTINAFEWLDESQSLSVVNKDDLYDLVAQLSYSGRLDNKITVKEATERIERFIVQSSSVVKDDECEHKPLMERKDGTLYCSSCNQNWTQEAWDEIHSKPVIQSSSVKNEWLEQKVKEAIFNCDKLLELVPEDNYDNYDPNDIVMKMEQVVYTIRITLLNILQSFKK